jgi:Sulfotransferase family
MSWPDVGEGFPPTPKNLRDISKRPPLDETPAVAGERFLFLGGLHKSGTSVLHRLLRAHPEISGFADTGFPQDEGQLIQSVYPPAWAYGGPGQFAFDPRSRLTESSKLVSVSNASLLLREWGAYFDLDRRILLEKSPPNIVHSRFLQALFPGAGFVFIVRHPIPVAYGTLKWTKTTVVDLMLHWCEAHRILLEDFDKLERAVIVRYEDFVTEPLQLMGTLYRFAGLPEFPLTETVSDHSGTYFARWRSERAEVMSELRDKLQMRIGILHRFGYSLSEPYTGPAGAPIAAP